MGRREWSPETHHQFPAYFRDIVRTMLILSLKDREGNPLFPECPIFRLPREILFQIFRFASWEILLDDFPSDIEDYLCQIPFGHWDSVVDDLRNLVTSNKKFSAKFQAILPQYTRDHFERNLFRIAVPGCEHEFVLSEFGFLKQISTWKAHYLDPNKPHLVVFDYQTRTILETLPIHRTEELTQFEILRQKIQNLLWSSVKSNQTYNATGMHAKKETQSAGIAYANKETQEIIACISVDYVETDPLPWAIGKLTSIWRYNCNSKFLIGTTAIHVLILENDINLDHKETVNTSVNQKAEEIVEEILRNIQKFFNNLSEFFDSGDITFRALRRTLPLCRKWDWNRLRNYKLH